MAYKILVFLFLISQVSFGQTNLPQPEPYPFIDSLLSKDKYVMEFVDFEYPKDIQEIVARWQKAMSEKREWFQQYFSKNYKEGEGMPYHENFGITKEDYQKIKDLSKIHQTAVVRSQTFLKVKRNSNIISFEADENGTEFLSTLKIDLTKKRLTFMNDTIPFSSEINTSPSNPFGEWHGYSWKKEVSNLGDKDELKMEKLVATITEIDFGSIKSNNKILFRLKRKDIDKGTVSANYDFASYLK